MHTSAQLCSLVKRSISKNDNPQGLGYGILAASSVIKVPQILALMKSKSAEGLAGLSFELENICFTIHASYGYLLGLPINSYGEIS